MQDKTTELLQTSKMYYDICYESCHNNNRGISIKDLKKKYNLRKRDIPVLLNFIKTYDVNYDMGYESISLDYLVYRFANDKELPDKEIKFEDLDEDLYEEVLYEEDIDDSCFIRIIDDIAIIQEKISSSDIDWTNASFIEGISDSIHDSWQNISNAKLNKDYIVNKKNGVDIPEHLLENKRKWIMAVVNLSLVYMDYRSGTGKKIARKKVVPAGLYYDKFLEKYIFVYTADKENYLDIEMDNIIKITVLDETYEIKPAFNIDKYIHSIQTEKMVLKVFHEAKVIQKLKELLSENQVNVKEYDGYDILEFMTGNPWQYLRVINGFGRSVVVKEPAYIQKNILDATRTALSYYDGF